MKEQRDLPTIEEVALGGLLHDVGKLLQRAHRANSDLPETVCARASDILPSRDGIHSHWHALWTDVFFDWTEREGLGWPRGIDRRWVRDLAVYHHAPLQAYRANPNLAATWLVTVADRVAAGADRKPRDEAADRADGSAGDRARSTPLDAIVSRLRLPSATGDRRSRHCHLPAVLDPDSMMPVSDAPAERVRQGYRDLWDAFRAGWHDLIARAHGDPVAFEEGLLSLSERLTWAVPSSTVDQPDVSLHDHARTVAAVAACLHAHHAARGELTSIEAMREAERPRLRFLVGDLSGLQSTLFRLRSEQVKGLNRILRGRSQRFALIADAAARRCRAAFGLPASCVLQSAGGRFLMVLPDVEAGGMERRLEGLRAEIDAWLAREYCGDLGLGLAMSEPFAAADLTRRTDEEDACSAAARARAVWDGLAVAGETARLRQLAGPAAGGIVDQGFRHGNCSACGVRGALAGEIARCAACSAEHDLGRRLPRAMAFGVDGTGQGDDLFGLTYRVATEAAGGRDAPLLGWRLTADGPGPAAYRFGLPWLPRHGVERSRYEGVEGFDEIEPGALKTFEALGRDARETLEGGRPVGRAMLAVLKADVDNLGLLFREGFGAEETGLARRAALSRMLDAYFSGRLMALLEREFPNAYTVYAGGDDLFIVAPWRDALALALRLRQDFGDFSGGNPDVTLSAGLSLFDPHTPISIAVAEAEERLSAAKGAGKDRVSAITAAPIAWAEFGTALENAEILNQWIRSGRISDAALYRFLSFDDARGRIASGQGRPQDYGWRARFGYHLARMLPRRTSDPAQREVADFLLALFGLDRPAGENGTASGVRLAISHALYRNR